MTTLLSDVFSRCQYLNTRYRFLIWLVTRLFTRTVTLSMFHNFSTLLNINSTSNVNNEQTRGPADSYKLGKYDCSQIRKQSNYTYPWSSIWRRSSQVAEEVIMRWTCPWQTKVKPQIMVLGSSNVTLQNDKRTQRHHLNRGGTGRDNRNWKCQGRGDIGRDEREKRRSRCDINAEVLQILITRTDILGHQVRQRRSLGRLWNSVIMYAQRSKIGKLHEKIGAMYDLLNPHRNRWW